MEWGREEKGLRGEKLEKCEWQIKAEKKGDVGGSVAIDILSPFPSLIPNQDPLSLVPAK